MSRRASLFFAAALAGLAAQDAAASGSSCEWRAPAHDPFQGDVPGAVDDYADIPAATRARLKARMQRQAYDDIVAIRRDSIEGNFRYEPALLDMHFGKRRLCGNVTRQSWKPEHEERGLAYCEDGHCVVVPLVCRNVSRILRKPAVAVTGGPAGSSEPLVFDPPSAGLPAGPAAPTDAGPTVRTLLALPPNSSAVPPSTDVPLGPGTLPPLPPAAEGPAPAVQPTPATPELPPAIPPAVATPPDAPGPLLPPAAPAPFPAPPMGLPPLPPAAPAVPEPTALLLWAAGLAAGTAWMRRRRITG